MQILLTGAEGNLGQHILSQSQHEIVGVGRENWSQLDEAMSSTDVVIHAAYDLKGRITSEPSRVMSSNLLTTMELLESMKRHNVRRLIFMSSCAVYGDVTHMREDVTCQPTSINGQVKYLNEQIIREFCTKNNIRHISLRVFNMYGGNDQFSILYKLKRAVHDGEVFQLNNHGVSQRDFIHVEDVARAVLDVVEGNPDFECMNLGTGISIKIADLLSIVKEKYPSIKIQNHQFEEVEYARADTSKLSKVVAARFSNVIDYVKKI